MRIGLIGHLCLDVVHLPDGLGNEHASESYGGIIWAVATLANLLSSDDVICPVFGIGTNEFDKVMKRLSRYENVDTAGIFKMDGPTNQVHLFYGTNGSQRVECSKYISDPIPFSRMERLTQADGILINMVSGFDITLETLNKIRTESSKQNVPVHFDFHSLSLGIDNEHKRFRKPVADWQKWCTGISSVQMSEEEAAGLTPEHLDEPSLAEAVLSENCHAMIVTRDRRGGTLFQKTANQVVRHEFHGIETKALDPTGCGDVFGASYMVEFLKNRNHLHAVEYANRVAAAKTKFVGVDGLDRMNEFLTSRVSA
jgi:sugar/nucleoside kinase (ribokinase family)